MTSDNIRSLFYEVKDLFPESNYYSKNSSMRYSESNKLLGPHAFRIGFWVVAKSEVLENRFDVGTFNNVYNDINVSKDQLTLEEARSWILKHASDAQKEASAQKLKDRKERITLAFVAAVIMLAGFLYFS